MKKNFVKLVGRSTNEELSAYFDDLGSETPLDYKEEKILLNQCNEPVIVAYFNRFRFSENAEVELLTKVSVAVLAMYINQYGLSLLAQRHVIDNNLLDVNRVFVKMRRYDDVDYLLDKGSATIISDYISYNPVENDNQLQKLLYHENTSLFTLYVNRGYFVSEAIKREIIENSLHHQFKAVAYRYYRAFRKKSNTAQDFSKLMSKVAEYGLSEELQLLVLTLNDRMIVEQMLMTMPLCVNAQEFMFKRNFDPQWFKFHVEHLYGVGGYRFEADLEAKLFKTLASRNIDECLTKFRHRDDVSFVKCASSKALEKYIKDYWLTDDAQVALIDRGNADLIKIFLSRYNPEHGICWQAEVKLVSLCSSELIDFYISFHTMCWDALEILKNRMPELHAKYYTLHNY